MPKLISKRNLIIAGACLITLAITLRTQQNKRQETQQENDETPEVRVTTTPALQVNPITEVRLEDFGIKIEYNTEKQVFEQLGTDTIVIRGKDTEPAKSMGDNLQKGYVVEIKKLGPVGTYNLQELATRKAQELQKTCPEKAEITQPWATTLQGEPSFAIKADRCDKTIIVNYVTAGNAVYRVVRAFQGDLGIKQQYQSETVRIMNSLDWLYKYDKPELQTYRSWEFGISLKHPWLDTQCCDVTEPLVENINKIVVLADPNNKNSNRFGVFGGIRRSGQNLEYIVNEQKTKLVQEYKAVKGILPKGLEERKLIIGGEEAIELRNYAWWGNLIYATPSNKHTLIVFVIPNEATPEFREVINQILKTVKFE